MDGLTPLFAILGSLALAATAAATWISVTTSRRLLGVERLYRARLYALQLLERWETGTHQARARLRKRFGASIKAKQPIPWTAFQEALDQGLAVDEDADSILTFLDHVGLCVKTDVVDEDLAENFFLVGPIAMWWDALSEFRAQEAEERGVDPWPNAAQLIANRKAEAAASG